MLFDPSHRFGGAGRLGRFFAFVEWKRKSCRKITQNQVLPNVFGFNTCWRCLHTSCLICGNEFEKWQRQRQKSIFLLWKRKNKNSLSKHEKRISAPFWWFCSIFVIFKITTILLGDVESKDLFQDLFLKMRKMQVIFFSFDTLQQL
jgi:hypothetical protein